MRLKSEMTTREAAQLVNLEPPAIRAAIREGRLKAELVKKAYVIRRADFAEYLANRERRSNGKQKKG